MFVGDDGARAEVISISLDDKPPGVCAVLGCAAPSYGISRLCSRHYRAAVEGAAVHYEGAAGAAVEHPPHYGGADNPYEAIKVIEAWGLDFALGNAVKYIARAGKKDASKLVEDLKKARWYLERAIANAQKT